MKVTICIGSACHLKGSRLVIEQLQHLVNVNGLSDKVELTGTFCSGHCGDNVHVTIGDDHFYLQPESTSDFFEKEIMGRLS
ncbi:MAG: (2Fe-2S) ferredoxin domain-containing protein [Clostridiales bacterium]|nr:(2Fe-2S) ferredoxin domain-containing protein [Clostridiales bacterium]